jgi:WD40 repeat protein
VKSSAGWLWILAATFAPFGCSAGPQPRPLTPAPAAPQEGTDPLPARALALLGTRRLSVAGFVRGLALSADGRRLVSAASDPGVTVWDVESGRAVLRFGEEVERVERVCWSPSGGRLMLAGLSRSGPSGRTPLIRLADPETGRILAKLDMKEAIKGAAFLAGDAKLLLGTSDGKILLWDPRDGSQTLVYRLDSGRLASFASTPDGSALALGADSGPILLIDVPTRGTRKLIRPRGVETACLSFSPDGRLVAAGDGRGSVEIFDASSGGSLRTFQSDRAAGTALACSQDGRILASTGPAGTTLWNTATGASLAALPSGGHALALTRDGRRVLYGSGSIHVYDLSSAAEMHPRSGHEGPVHSVAFSRNGSAVATGGWDAAVRFWNARDGKIVRVLREFQGPVRSLAFSPRGSFLAFGGDDPVHPLRVWDLAGESVLRKINNAGNAVSSVHWGADEDTLLSRGGGVRIWNPRSGDVFRTLDLGDGIEDRVSAYSPDGKIVALSRREGGISLFRVATDEKIRDIVPDLEADAREARAVAFDPEEEAIAVVNGTGQEVAGVDVRSGHIVFRLSSRDEPVTRLAYSKDGKLIATGHERGSVLVWEKASGAEVLRFRGHTGRIEALDFDRDGRRLASAGEDSLVWIWGLAGDEAEDPGALSTAWTALSGAPADAFAAGWRMALTGDSAADFLRSKLQPASAASVKTLLDDLGGEDAEVRGRAFKSILERGSEIESELRRALAGGLPPESEARVRQALDRLKGTLLTSPGSLRRGRAIQILERIGSERARDILKALAAASPSTRESTDAARALLRLEARPP